MSIRDLILGINNLSDEQAENELLRSSVIRNSPQVITKHAGGKAVDWSASLGALTLASSNTGEAIALDPAVLCCGQPSVKCTLSTSASQTYIGRYTPTNAISFKDFRSLSIPYRITGNESAAGGFGFEIWLKAASGKQARIKCVVGSVQPGDWAIATWTRGDTTSTNVSFTGGASGWSFMDTETITAVDIVTSSATGSNGYPVWIGPILVNRGGPKGVLSLRMDGE